MDTNRTSCLIDTNTLSFDKYKSGLQAFIHVILGQALKQLFSHEMSFGKRDLLLT